MHDFNSPESTGDIPSFTSYGRQEIANYFLAWPEIEHDLANGAISQVNLDQLNNRCLLSPNLDDDFIANLLMEVKPEVTPHLDYIGFSQYREDDNDVLNFTVDAMKLTRKKLVKTEEWPEWLAKEHEQLDQYEAQGMFVLELGARAA